MATGGVFSNELEDEEGASTSPSSTFPLGGQRSGSGTGIFAPNPFSIQSSIWSPGHISLSSSSFTSSPSSNGGPNNTANNITESSSSPSNQNTINKDESIDWPSSYQSKSSEEAAACVPACPSAYTRNSASSSPPSSSWPLPLSRTPTTSMTVEQQLEKIASTINVFLENAESNYKNIHKSQSSMGTSSVDPRHLTMEHSAYSTTHRKQLQSLRVELLTLRNLISSEKTGKDNELKSSQEVFKEELYKHIIILLETELNCVVCSEIFIQPSVIDCGHTFCNYCIVLWLREKRECPICRSIVANEPKKHVEMDNFLSKAHEILSEEIRIKRGDLLKDREEALRNLPVLPPRTRNNNRPYSNITEFLQTYAREYNDNSSWTEQELRMIYPANPHEETVRLIRDQMRAMQAAISDRALYSPELNNRGDHYYRPLQVPLFAPENQNQQVTTFDLSSTDESDESDDDDDEDDDEEEDQQSQPSTSTRTRTTCCGVPIINGSHGSPPPTSSQSQNDTNVPRSRGSGQSSTNRLSRGRLAGCITTAMNNASSSSSSSAITSCGSGRLDASAPSFTPSSSGYTVIPRRNSGPRCPYLSSNPGQWTGNPGAHLLPMNHPPISPFFSSREGEPDDPERHRLAMAQFRPLYDMIANASIDAANASIEAANASIEADRRRRQLEQEQQQRQQLPQCPYQFYQTANSARSSSFNTSDLPQHSTVDFDSITSEPSSMFRNSSQIDVVPVPFSGSVNADMLVAQDPTPLSNGQFDVSNHHQWSSVQQQSQVMVLQSPISMLDLRPYQAQVGVGVGVGVMYPSHLSNFGVTTTNSNGQPGPSDVLPYFQHQAHSSNQSQRMCPMRAHQMQHPLYGHHQILRPPQHVPQNEEFNPINVDDDVHMPMTSIGGGGSMSSTRSTGESMEIQQARRRQTTGGGAGDGGYSSQGRDRRPLRIVNPNTGLQIYPHGPGGEVQVQSSNSQRRERRILRIVDPDNGSTIIENPVTVTGSQPQSRGHGPNNNRRRGHTHRQPSRQRYNQF